MEVAADFIAQVELERRALEEDRQRWVDFTGIVGQDNDTICARHSKHQLQDRYNQQHAGDVARALVLARAAVAKLTARMGNMPAEAVCTLVNDWFKLPVGALDIEQTAALAKLKADFDKIVALLDNPGNTFYLSFDPPGKDVAAQSERRFGFLYRTNIALYPLHVADTDAERRATTLVHEVSHHVADTSDWVFAQGRDREVYVYGPPSNDAPVQRQVWLDIGWKGRVGNADTLAYFARASV